MARLSSFYLSKLSKLLKTDRRTKQKLFDNLRTRFHQKTEEEILAELGDPNKLAEKYNQQYRKSPAYGARKRQRIIMMFTAVPGILSAVFLAFHIVVDKVLYGDVDISQGPVALVFSKGPFTATYALGSAWKIALFFGVCFLALFLSFLLLRHSTKRYFPACLT